MRGSPTPPGKCVFPADCTRRTRTLPRVRSAVVLPTVGDPRRIRSLQPVQPAVLLLTAGHPRRTHSLLPVQPVVLFTCGGRVLFTLSALRAPTKAPYKTDLHRKTRRALKRPGGPGQGRHRSGSSRLCSSCRSASATCRTRAFVWARRALKVKSTRPPQVKSTTGCTGSKLCVRRG